MSESTAGWMGIKLLTLIAGFAGGVISLSFIRDLSKPQAVLAVMTGLGVAAFMAPLGSPWLAQWFAGLVGESSDLWVGKVEAALGFICGLTGMTVVPGIISLAQRFRDDPLWIVRFIISRGKGGE